jgi:hypothetical protein
MRRKAVPVPAEAGVLYRSGRDFLPGSRLFFACYEEDRSWQAVCFPYFIEVQP